MGGIIDVLRWAVVLLTLAPSTHGDAPVKDRVCTVNTLQDIACLNFEQPCCFGQCIEKSRYDLGTCNKNLTKYGGNYVLNGDCPVDLRHCLEVVNQRGPIDTIVFNVPLPPKEDRRVIYLVDSLPAVSQKVTIDGGDLGIVLSGKFTTNSNGSSCNSGEMGCSPCLLSTDTNCCTNGLETSASLTLKNVHFEQFGGSGLVISSEDMKMIGGGASNNCGHGVWITFVANRTIVNPSDKGNRTVFLNNGGHGVLSDGENTVLYGIQASGNTDGVHFGETAKGSRLYPHVSSGISLITRNRGHGVVSAAPNSVIVGCNIGTNLQATSNENNTLHGIYIMQTAINSVIGSVQARNVIGSHGGTGIHCDAPNVLIQNCRIGLGFNDTSLSCNQGIVLNETAENSTIGGGGYNYVTGSRSIGILVGARNTRIFRTIVGYGLSRVVSNGAHGIFVTNKASNTLIGGSWANGVWRATDVTTIVGGNRGDGIRSFAPRTTIRGAAIGLAPPNFTAAASNGLNGIGLYQGATNAIIGNVVGPRSSVADSVDTIIGGNFWNGIFCNASNLRVLSASIGIARDGLSGVGNGRDGIFLGSAADFAFIGARISATQPLPKTLIGGNLGNGIHTMAAQTSISNSLIGLGADLSTRIGNRQAGIFFDQGASKGTVGDNGPLGLQNSRSTFVCGNFGDGIQSNASGTVINNVKIGLAGSGNITVGNMGHGVHLLSQASNAIVGNRWPSSSTIISGNGLDGVHGSSKSVAISMCYIGVDFFGRNSLGNLGSGISLDEDANTAYIGVNLGTQSFNSVFGNVSALTAVTLISGNIRSGIMSSAPNTNIVATRVGTNILGVSALPNGRGIYFLQTATDSTVGEVTDGGGANPFHTVLVSGNNGTGISTAASRTKISNSIIGLSINGRTGLGNARNGIAVFATAQNCILGDVKDRTTLIGANKQNGVYSNAPSLNIKNTMIGIGILHEPLGNEKHGIHLDIYAQSTAIGERTFNVPNAAANLTIIANNGGYGIYSSAPGTLVRHCVVGTTRLGKAAGNVAGGIFLTADAVQSSIGGLNYTTTIVSGNLGNGIQSEAPSLIILNALVGLNLDLEKVPNSGHGVVLSETAAASSVGFNNSHHNTLISGNSMDGIVVNAPNVRLFNLGVGVIRRDSDANSKPGGNGGNGLTIGPTAHELLVVGNEIIGNSQDGLFINGASNITITNNIVGDDQDSQKSGQQHGNLGYGIRVQGVFSADIYDNTIGGNGFLGVAVETDDSAAHRESISVLNRIESNGFRAQACSLCECTGVSMDCTSSSLKEFGSLFPTNIPSDTEQINLAGINLISVAWEELQSLRRLRSLDLSGNPLLNPIPDSGAFGSEFQSLVYLSIASTNAQSLHADTFKILSGTLEYLDVSNLHGLSDPDSLNLGTFQNLKMMTYFSHECPPGYYGATNSSLLSARVPCIRCPANTYKPDAGGSHADCHPCPPDTTNEGNTSISSCIPLPPSEITKFPSSSCNDSGLSPGEAAGITALVLLLLFAAFGGGIYYYLTGRDRRHRRLPQDKGAHMNYAGSSRSGPGPLLQPRQGNFHLATDNVDEAKSNKKLYETNTDSIALQAQLNNRLSLTPTDESFEEAGGYLQITEPNDEDGEC
eukprot:m.80303 g.80303  ORF g.80303 m.80303 type:complete len:1626 (+) comp12751_c0_seq1:287-5164(+)